jgi:hypothetical protein
MQWWKVTEYHQKSTIKYVDLLVVEVKSGFMNFCFTHQGYHLKLDW